MILVPGRLRHRFTKISYSQPVESSLSMEIYPFYLSRTFCHVIFLFPNGLERFAAWHLSIFFVLSILPRDFNSPRVENTFYHWNSPLNRQKVLKLQLIFISFTGFCFNFSFKTGKHVRTVFLNLLLIFVSLTWRYENWNA